MRFDILTLFPRIFDSYFSESILKRAQEAGRIEMVMHNIRDFATDKHKTTDDIPYGGGAGMVMKVEPIYRCVQSIKNVEEENPSLLQKTDLGSKVRILLFSAKGKRFTQRDAERLSKYDRLILICGRYEGVDERVAEHIADEEISIGDFVLTGGEIPAMTVVDSVSRLLPGVLGNRESLSEESFNGNGTEREEDCEKKEVLEYPQYTRPEEFNGWRVPEVLLSGHHKEIEKWRGERRNREERKV